MSLKKIRANHPSILSVIPEDVLQTKNNSENETIKTLGIISNPQSDDFSYNFKAIKPGPITKAKVLSEIASIFDLIGWIGPVALRLKPFMKKLWLLKIEWTDEIFDAKQEK